MNGNILILTTLSIVLYWLAYQLKWIQAMENLDEMEIRIMKLSEIPQIDYEGMKTISDDLSDSEGEIISYDSDDDDEDDF